MDNSDSRFSPELPVRVLLVEDNPEHSFIAVRVLHQLLGEGSEIIVAESAEEAIGLISQFTEHDRPDLILVDLRLPDNRGLEQRPGVFRCSDRRCQSSASPSARKRRAYSSQFAITADMSWRKNALQISCSNSSINASARAGESLSPSSSTSASAAPKS